MANYVDNQKFYAAIVEYKNRLVLNPQERMPEEIGEYILLIANNLAKRYNFAAYTYRDEMVLDGILRAVEVFKNFDPNKSTNPFAYFTNVIFRSFIQRISKEKDERKMRNHLIMVNEIFATNENDDTGINKDHIIGDFEFNAAE